MNGKPKYYDWQKTMSYQTGSNGEICFVIGGKGIGKTFGLRKLCVERFLKHGELFAEFMRTNAERDDVMPGYFDKLQSAGYFTDYIFKTEKNAGYIAREPIGDDARPDWQLMCYFVSLTNFQREKKRTFVTPKRIIFDEAIIDVKDRHHRYLNDEFFIFANLLDTVSRQQPGDGDTYKVFLLSNAVDMTCPYMRHLGVNKVPKFGYSYYRDKSVLVHYVEPWDADERKAKTLVGRMLDGQSESAVIFDNEFEDVTGNEIMLKTPNAKYRFAFKWGRVTFAIWIDGKRGLWFVTEKLPKGAGNIYTLTKRDSSIDYKTVQSVGALTRILKEIFYIGGLRYESPSIRESFFEVLTFIGVR